MKATSYKRARGGTTMRFKMTEAELRRLDDDMEGLCLACGTTRSNCEPDAREYPCEGCGERRVYGAMECLERGWVTITSCEEE